METKLASVDKLEFPSPITPCQAQFIIGKLDLSIRWLAWRFALDMDLTVTGVHLGYQAPLVTVSAMVPRGRVRAAPSALDIVRQSVKPKLAGCSADASTVLVVRIRPSW